MKKQLEVKEFDYKSDLVRFVNTYSERLEIVSITSSQEDSLSYSHFLWYYDKEKQEIESSEN